MISESEYNKLRKQIKQWEQEKQQAEGAIKQIQKQLADEFGIRTIEQAKKKIKKLKREVEINEKKFSEAIEELQKKHPELFE